MKRTREITFFLISLLGCVAITALWWVAIGHDSTLGTTARWLARSHQYKAEVLAQPETKNGELKHVKWSEWGWGAQDTTVYLAFDPADSLSSAANSHQPGKYHGMPCEVLLVRRIESHWYTIQFYTDQDWRNNC